MKCRRSLPSDQEASVRVFDSVQATWNLLEQGAESALKDAHDAGFKVVVKESLANGRLTQANRDEDDVLFPSVARIRKLAEGRGTTIEMLAMAAALSRPWADVVLTGAATVGQIQVNVGALKLDNSGGFDDELHSAYVSSSEYWRARSSFSWN